MSGDSSVPVQVQQMVVEMKSGFSKAMEELSKIQYGDQTLQQQLADNKKECAEEMEGVKQAVQDLKTEVQNLCGRIQEVSDVQRGLQEKIDNYQSEKDILLEELENSGAITNQIRLRLSGAPGRENNNTIPPDVAPMVHPYLDSLQNHNQRGPEEQYNSDSSLTAAVSRSLNLTQALGEKCLHLDISTSSDEEENSRHSHSGSGHVKPMKRHSSFQYDRGSRSSQKIPLHENLMEEVHREEAARDIVEAEREYCNQVWSLIEDFMNPLRNDDMMTRRDFNMLFPSYIPHIYEQHCIILRRLEERMKKWKRNGVVGDIFAKFTDAQDGDGLTLYKDFINDFPTVITTMNKWFSHSPHFRQLMQSQCLANSPVLPLLLAPLQQVPKYSLLLKNLLKYTPVDHPDRYYLESSLSRLKHFLNHMNDDLEHAMQVINGGGQQMTRSRETGHSARSRSSGSSGEVNHVSHDSGVNSNEEDRVKSPMSPNSARRYLLQMLREKREHDGHPGRNMAEGRSQSPHIKKQTGYGSHPDLTNQYSGYQDGRMSPYLATLPQSKMFSSLSKLPLPKESSRRSRSHRLQDRPQINTNYLRPLTPQVFPTSTSAHSFDSARRRDEPAEKTRARPASAMEFGYDQADSHEQYLDMIAQQASLAISPPHSTSSDRSRRDLQLSLQKLLVETNNASADYSDNENDESGTHLTSYHKQFLASKERIMRVSKLNENNADSQNQEHSTNRESTRPTNSHTQEDFGIYGDDDEEDNDTEYDRGDVQPMRLLPDTHKPKIMVPRWRQNASPLPPSYTSTVDQMNKSNNDFTSEENLAASLAQSLLNSPRKQGSSKEQRAVEADATDAMRTAADGNTGRVKKRARVPESPRGNPQKSLVRHSPVSESPAESTFGKSVDGTPSRPSDLNLSNTNSPSHVSLKPKMHSAAKLNDVIAYTADCIEKSDTNRSSSSADDAGSKSQDSSPRPPVSSLSKQVESPAGKLDISTILSDQNMKVSSVDTDQSSSADKVTKSELKLSFSTSPSNSPLKTSVSPVNTESIVHYFQNRNQLNQAKSPVVENAEKGSSRIPTFISADTKTSTPINEHQPFGTFKSSGKDTLNGYGKRESGRMVRGDEIRKSNGSDSQNGVREEVQTNGTNTYRAKPEIQVKDTNLRPVDKLRLSFEKQKQLSDDRKSKENAQQIQKIDLNTGKLTIQKQFNDISASSKKSDGTPKQPILKTFSPLPHNNVESDTKEGGDHVNGINGLVDPAEPKHGLYKKAGQLRTPTKYSTESSASARQIQKLERSVSPSGRPLSPVDRAQSPNGKEVGSLTYANQYEKFKKQIENSSLTRPQKRGVSPQRQLDTSMIPQRSKSPTKFSRSSVERERPKSTTELANMSIDRGDSITQDSNAQLKSAMKDRDTKIPILKKPGAQLSKSTEDISKMKKKSAFKDQLKNIFSRKKKKSKLYSNGVDIDDDYSNHITLDEDSSFQRVDYVDDVLSFPLSRDRRCNSTSQILQAYLFEDEYDDDDDEISEV